MWVSCSRRSRKLSWHGRGCTMGVTTEGCPMFWVCKSPEDCSCSKTRSLFQSKLNNIDVLKVKSKKNCYGCRNRIFLQMLGIITLDPKQFWEYILEVFMYIYIKKFLKILKKYLSCPSITVSRIGSLLCLCFQMYIDN